MNFLTSSENLKYFNLNHYPISRVLSTKENKNLRDYNIFLYFYIHYCNKFISIFILELSGPDV